MSLLSVSALKCLVENYRETSSTEIGKLDMSKMLKSETEIFSRIFLISLHLHNKSHLESCLFIYIIL